MMGWHLISKEGALGVWVDDEDKTPLTVTVHDVVVFEEVPDGPVPDDNG